MAFQLSADGILDPKSQLMGKYYVARLKYHPNPNLADNKEAFDSMIAVVHKGNTMMELKDLQYVVTKCNNAGIRTPLVLGRAMTEASTCSWEECVKQLDDLVSGGTSFTYPPYKPCPDLPPIVIRDRPLSFVQFGLLAYQLGRCSDPKGHEILNSFLDSTDPCYIVDATPEAFYSPPAIGPLPGYGPPSCSTNVPPAAAHTKVEKSVASSQAGSPINPPLSYSDAAQGAALILAQTTQPPPRVPDLNTPPPSHPVLGEQLQMVTSTPPSVVLPEKSILSTPDVVQLTSSSSQGSLSKPPSSIGGSLPSGSVSSSQSPAIFGSTDRRCRPTKPQAAIPPKSQPIPYSKPQKVTPKKSQAPTLPKSRSGHSSKMQAPPPSKHQSGTSSCQAALPPTGAKANVNQAAPLPTGVNPNVNQAAPSPSVGNAHVNQAAPTPTGGNPLVYQGAPNSTLQAAPNSTPQAAPNSTPQAVPSFAEAQIMKGALDHIPDLEVDILGEQIEIQDMNADIEVNTIAKEVADHPENKEKVLLLVDKMRLSLGIKTSINSNLHAMNEELAARVLTAENLVKTYSTQLPPLTSSVHSLTGKVEQMAVQICKALDEVLDDNQSRFTTLNTKLTSIQRSLKIIHTISETSSSSPLDIESDAECSSDSSPAASSSVTAQSAAVATSSLAPDLTVVTMMSSPKPSPVVQPSVVPLTVYPTPFVTLADSNFVQEVSSPLAATPILPTVIAPPPLHPTVEMLSTHSYVSPESFPLGTSMCQLQMPPPSCAPVSAMPPTPPVTIVAPPPSPMSSFMPSTPTPIPPPCSATLP